MIGDERSPVDDFAVSTGDQVIADALTSVSDSLRELARTQARVERRSWWQIVAIAIVGLICASMLFLGLIVFNLTRLIQDCIDPAGQCYQDSRSRTVEVQRQIVQAQHDEATRTLTVTCNLTAQEGHLLPPECAGIAIPPTTVRR